MKLFGLGGDDGAAAASQAAQRKIQARQNQRVQADEADQNREIGARRRLLQARASGGSPTLFGTPAGVLPTLG